MFKLSNKKIIVILMTVLFTVTLIPASAFAGDSDAIKTKMAAYQSKKGKKVQEAIKKTESQIKNVKENILDHSEGIQEILENEITSLLTDIDENIEGGIENLDEENLALIEDALANIDAMGEETFKNIKTLESKYKQLQKIKRKKPETYLKEIQKILVKYNNINDDLTDVDVTIDELTDLLNQIITDLNELPVISPDDDTDYTDPTESNDPEVNPDQPGDPVVEQPNEPIDQQPDNPDNAQPELTPSTIEIAQ